MQSLLRALCNFTAGEGAESTRVALTRAGVAGGQSVVQRLTQLVMRPPSAMGTRSSIGGGPVVGEPLSASVARREGGGLEATPIRRTQDGDGDGGDSRSPRHISVSMSRSSSSSSSRGISQTKNPTNSRVNLLPLALRVVSNCCLAPACLHQLLKTELLERCITGLKQLPVHQEPAPLQLARLSLLRGVAASSDEGRDHIVSSKGALIALRDILRDHPVPAVRASVGIVLAQLCGLRAAKTALLAAGILPVLVQQACGWHAGAPGSKGSGSRSRGLSTPSGQGGAFNAWDSSKENNRSNSSFNSRRTATKGTNTLRPGESVAASWAAVRANSAVCLWALVHKFAKAAGQLSYDGKDRAMLVGSQAELSLELSGNDAQQKGTEARLLRATLDAIESVLTLADSV